MKRFLVDNIKNNSLLKQNAIALGGILFFFIVGYLSVQNQSVTIDEPSHYRYGNNIWNGDSSRFDDSKMPVSAWNVLPKRVSLYLPYERMRQLLGTFLAARLMTLLFSCAVAFLIFYWARQLYGLIPAIWALFLFIFDPNMIAHSQLVTTDLYAVGTITFVFYTLWIFANHRTTLNGLLCALALGLSLIAKYTSIVLLPLSLLVIFLYDLKNMSFPVNWIVDGKRLFFRYSIYIIVGLVISLLIINIAFLFNQTFMPFGKYEFSSHLFKALQNRIKLLNLVPVPVPYPYLNGLDQVFFRESTGYGYGHIYLLGIAQGHGFPGYYIIAGILKVPIATQILILASFFVFLTNKSRRKNFYRNELFLLVPTVFYGIYFNFFYETQIGFRYILVIYPFLYIFVGSLFVDWSSLSKTKKVLIMSLGAYLVISVLSYTPDFLPYFNEIVWDRKTSYKYLADSNLDWGQASKRVNQFLADHPQAKLAGTTPDSGLLVIRANKLTGVESGSKSYAWLRENFEPVDTIAHSYLVYEISPGEVDNLCLTTSYCKGK